MWNTRWTTCRRPRRTPKKHSSIKAKPDGWVLPRCHASKPLTFRSRLIGHSLLFLPFITLHIIPPFFPIPIRLVLSLDSPSLLDFNFYSFVETPLYNSHYYPLLDYRPLLCMTVYLAVWSVYYNRCTIHPPSHNYTFHPLYCSTRANKLYTNALRVSLFLFFFIYVYVTLLIFVFFLVFCRAMTMVKKIRTYILNVYILYISILYTYVLLYCLCAWLFFFLFLYSISIFLSLYTYVYIYIYLCTALCRLSKHGCANCVPLSIFESLCLLYCLLTITHTTNPALLIFMLFDINTSRV